MTPEEARKVCEQFAIKHKLIFQDEGEVGFGRPCVGFLKSNDCYVSHNPISIRDISSFEDLDEDNLKVIEGLECEGAIPPRDIVPDAYHKHDCLCVLGRGDESIIQLAHWVKRMESWGTVEIVEYETGATGIQALFTGTHQWAVIIREESDE